MHMLSSNGIKFFNLTCLKALEQIIYRLFCETEDAAVKVHDIYSNILEHSSIIYIVN